MFTIVYIKRSKTIKEIIVRACGLSETIPGYGTGNLYILCKFWHQNVYYTALIDSENSFDRIWIMLPRSLGILKSGMRWGFV